MTVLIVTAIVPLLGVLAGLAFGELVLELAVGIALDLFVVVPGVLLGRPPKHRWRGEEVPHLVSFLRWPWGPQ